LLSIVVGLLFFAKEKRMVFGRCYAVDTASIPEDDRFFAEQSLSGDRSPGRIRAESVCFFDRNYQKLDIVRGRENGPVAADIRCVQANPMTKFYWSFSWN